MEPLGLAPILDMTASKPIKNGKEGIKDSNNSKSMRDKEELKDNNILEMELKKEEMKDGDVTKPTCEKEEMKESGIPKTKRDIIIDNTQQILDKLGNITKVIVDRNEKLKEQGIVGKETTQLIQTMEEAQTAFNKIGHVKVP